MAYGYVPGALYYVYWGFSASASYVSGVEDNFESRRQRSAAGRYTFEGDADGRYLMFLLPSGFDAVDLFRFGETGVRFNTAAGPTIESVAYTVYVSSEVQEGTNIQLRAP